MSELYDILVETPPTKVILLALDQGLWDCERSLAELSALCEANHMEAVAEVTQKRQTPETGIVLGSGKLEEAAAAAAELGAECAVFDGELTGSQIRNISTALGGMEVIDRTMLILEIFRSRAVTGPPPCPRPHRRTGRKTGRDGKAPGREPQGPRQNRDARGQPCRLHQRGQIQPDECPVRPQRR